MKRTAAIALFVVATSVTAYSALAQDHQAKAAVPFSFSVNNNSLPAGNYAIGSDVASPRVLSLRERDKRVSLLIMGSPGSSSQGNGKLVFHRYGNQYFLTEICSPKGSQNVTFPTSKAEKRAKAEVQEASLGTTENVLIALR